MNKFKKTLSLILVAVMTFTVFIPSFGLHADSASEVQPRYNNTASAKTTGSVSSSGRLTAYNSYTGIKDVTTHAQITTYVEKKILFLWFRVDLGITDDQWVDVVYGHTYTGSHYVNLESKGTYRITTEYKIYGSGGSADVINSQVEVKY